MTLDDRNKLVELSRKYCEESVENEWCYKHDCDFCTKNLIITEMLENIDSVLEE